MPVTIQDRQGILDLMTGWMHRDLANWERLGELFHPDGIIEVSWFEGPAKAFIDASVGMGKSDFRSKHFIGQPIVRFCGRKAIAETNAMIIVENVALNLGCITHNRFFDLVEKRDGAWKILRRQTIYDMGYFTFPCGMAEIEHDALANYDTYNFTSPRGTVEIDHNVLAKYPREYAPLAYLLEQTGFSVKRVFATKGSELEKKMKEQGDAWLAS
jgi:hypothetical protein